MIIIIKIDGNNKFTIDNSRNRNPQTQGFLEEFLKHKTLNKIIQVTKMKLNWLKDFLALRVIR